MKRTIPQLAFLLALCLSVFSQAQTNFKSRLIAGVSQSSGMPCPDSAHFFYPTGIGGDLDDEENIPFSQLLDYQCDFPSANQWLFKRGGRTVDSKGRLLTDTVWLAYNPGEAFQPYQARHFIYAVDMAQLTCLQILREGNMT